MLRPLPAELLDRHLHRPPPPADARPGAAARRARDPHRARGRRLHRARACSPPSNAALVEMAVGLAADARPRGRDPGAGEGAARAWLRRSPARAAAPARRAARDPRGDRRAAVELFARLGYHATSMRAIAAAARHPAGRDLPLVPEQGGDPGPPPGRLHGAADRAGRRRDRAPRPARAALAAAVREHVVYHGLHPPRGVRHRQRDPRADRRPARGADRPARRLPGALRRADRAPGSRDGSLRTSDPRVATYAILLQCTGVALWFDPAGRSASTRSPAIHVELVLGSLGAERETDRRGGGGVKARVKPPALPEKATIAVVAPVEPAADALGDRAGDRVLRGPRPRGRLRPQPPQGPRLPRRHRRGARRRPAVGAVGAGHRHGPRALRRLRRRPPAPPDRLGRGRRPAHRLRLQRHHRAAPRARRPRRLGHASTGRTSCASRARRTS